MKHGSLDCLASIFKTNILFMLTNLNGILFYLFNVFLVSSAKCVLDFFFVKYNGTVNRPQ